jgi:hypothetical protein
MNGVRASGRPGGTIVSAQYLKNEMSDLNETWYTLARWWEEEVYWYWGSYDKGQVGLWYDEWRPGGTIVSAQYLKNEMSDLNEIWYTHAKGWEEEAYWYWGS